MVLHIRGRVGRRHFRRVFKANALETLFLLYGKRVIKVVKVIRVFNDFWTLTTLMTLTLSLNCRLNQKMRNGRGLPQYPLWPFRTEKSSPVAPMVLHTCGRVGRRHFRRVFKANALETLFLLYWKRVIKLIKVVWVIKVVNDLNDFNDLNQSFNSRHNQKLRNGRGLPQYLLWPFRTEKSSPVAPMVLHIRGRVGRRHFNRVFKANALETLFLLFGWKRIRSLR